MKKLITSFFLLFIAFLSSAQNDTSYYTQRNKSVKDRLNASISGGAGVMVFNPKSTSSYSYVAPSFQYQLGSKFTVSAGLIHFNVTGNPFINRNIGDNKYLNNNKTFSGNILQVGGLYKLNDRLTVSGSVLYQVNPPSYKQTNFNSTSFGLDYKVTQHTTLSIKTNIIQGNNLNSLYYSNPLGPNSMSNGFQQHPFNTYPTGMFPSNF